MDRICGVKKQTNNRFLNLYQLDTLRRDQSHAPYFVASRAADPAQLKAISGENKPDGVVIYGVYGENKDRLVLIRQYRYPVGDYVYEFPAGLVDTGETAMEAGIREMHEETGLEFHPKVFETTPFFTTVGMTDESCSTVFGYCTGTPTNLHQEASEDIQVILATREDCRRILKEEKVALMCGYMMMHFIASEGDPLTFLDKQ